jgi:hypothetical protein
LWQEKGINFEEGLSEPLAALLHVPVRRSRPLLCSKSGHRHFGCGRGVFLLEGVGKEKPEVAILNMKKLPPDPEEMNDQRAAWAEDALEQFASQTRHRADDRDWEEIVSDFLSNMHHFCDRAGLNWGACVDRGHDHYYEETLPEEAFQIQKP